jgi:hypothetical protein
MRRRKFITVLAGTAASPLAGNAQQSERVRRIGALYFFAQNDASSQAFATAFAQALGRLGRRENENIRSTPALRPAISHCSNNTRHNWSAWRPMPFSPARGRLLSRSESRRARYR